MRRLGIGVVLALGFIAGCSKSDPVSLGKDIFMMPLTDWSLTTESITEMQHEDYVLSTSGREYIYEYSGNEDIIMSS